MSKIARVFHLNKEIQKIYKNGVLQKLFFDWKHYIGEELNIEYAKGYCSHRININGKVYQNLVSNLDKLIGNVYTLKNTAKVISNLLRVSTTYTFIVSISEANYSFRIGAIIVINYPTLNTDYISISRQNGIFKIKYTVKEEIPKSINISPHANNDATSSFKLDNLIILEGDLSSENITEDDIKYLEEGAFVPENKVIAGKTYQNLVTNLDELVGNIYTRDTVAIIDTSLFKANTTYTAIITISESNYSYEKYGAIFSIFYPTLTNGYVSISLKDGTFKLKFTTKEETPSKIQVGVQYENSASSSFKLNNLIVLEGDYTSIDLPNSINGIESVGEREFVKSKNLYNKKFMNSAIRAQGQFVDSRGFIFTINDECTFKINGTNTTGCTIMSENILDLLEDGKSYILSTNLLHFLAIITYKDDTPPKYTSAFTVNKSVMNTIKLYNQWPDTEIVTYDNFVVKNQIEEGTTATEYEPFYEYCPVTIRNYNYKRGTDNIVLPNGVKNSIDTIDGKKVHTRRVGAVLLNGRQDMTISNVNQTLTTRVRIRMDNAKVSKNNLLCNWFIRTEAHGDYEYIIIQDSSEGICLFISVLNTKLSAPTADGVKQYFSENPLWVFYELATPTYTYLESDLYDDITIPTPSNIRNEIYLENGKWYHKRNIGKVIFDGSSDEKWSHYKGSWARFDIKMPNDAKMYSTRKPVYAVGYQFDASKNEDKIIFISGVVDSVNKLYIYNYAYTTVADFRAYLAENPLEVYYELAEPVISELYFNDITYKINEPLRSLPNGTCDTIEGNKLVQRVGKVVLDGSLDEGWGTSSIIPQEETMIVQATLITKTVKPNSCLLSNKFNQISDWNDTETIRMGGTNNVLLYIGINRNKLDTEDLKGFEKWLSENPVTVYYELATPIETEITPDKIPLFSIKEGLTVLKSTNNITPQIELDCLVRNDFQNMCPNTWVNGDIAIVTGEELSSSTSRIKLQDYIAVQPNTTYYCDTSNETVYSTTGKIGVRYYKNDKTYISGGGIGIAKTSYNKFTTPEDCYYIKFIVETLDTNYKMYLRPVK